jgi:(2Fe-2S) ferredoxin
MAREISASNPDPRVLVTWVKKICRLKPAMIHHPDKPDGVWYQRT